MWSNRTEKAAGEEDCLETVAENAAKTHLRIASATFRHGPIDNSHLSDLPFSTDIRLLGPQASDLSYVSWTF